MSFNGAISRSQYNLARRQYNGTLDGSLTRGESNVVSFARGHLAGDIAAARADGDLTRCEKLGIRRERNSVSHLIFNLRHNEFGNMPSIFKHGAQGLSASGWGPATPGNVWHNNPANGGWGGGGISGFGGGFGGFGGGGFSPFGGGFGLPTPSPLSPWGF